MAKKMKRTTTQKTSLLSLRIPDAKEKATLERVHTYQIVDDGKRFRCETDSRGHVTPGNQSRTRIVLDASDGFIPLWAPEVTLKWRFKQSSLESFENPAAVASAIEDLLAKALIKWGDAVPVKFSKRQDNYDFQIVVKSQDDCDINGCVLASAFFPDAGRHEFVIYPQMFEQSHEEQVETFCHELGHVFGLRHFFAQVSETAFPSEIFGVHDKFSIMNYGSNSILTDNDKADLIRLYEGAWNGTITEVNGTPIRLVKPFSSLAESSTLVTNPNGVSSVPSFIPHLGAGTPTRVITKEIVYIRR